MILSFLSTYPSSSSDVFKYFASVKRTPSAFVLVSRSLPAKSHLKSNQQRGHKLFFSQAETQSLYQVQQAIVGQSAKRDTVGPNTDSTNVTLNNTAACSHSSKCLYNDAEAEAHAIRNILRISSRWTIIKLTLLREFKPTFWQCCLLQGTKLYR